MIFFFGNSSAIACFCVNHTGMNEHRTQAMSGASLKPRTEAALRNQTKENGIQNMSPEEISKEILRTRYGEDRI